MKVLTTTISSLLIGLFVCAPIWSQQQTTLPFTPSVNYAAPQVLQYNTLTLTASSTNCSTANSCVVLSLGPADQTANISLAGSSYSGVTVQFEAQLGDGNWTNISCPTWAQGAAVSSATATGAWQCDVAGKTQLRARLSAYTSGTVIATLSSSTARSTIGSIPVPQGLSTTSSPTFAQITAQSIGQIVYANAYSGSDLSAQIAAAILALNPTNGGIIDARGYATTQNWGTTVNIDRPVYLLLPCQKIVPTVELFSFTGINKFNLQGCGPRSTLIVPNGLSGSVLLETGNRSTLSDFEIQMINDGLGDYNKIAIEFDAGANSKQQELRRVAVNYSGGGTGTAILVNDTNNILIEDALISAANLGLSLTGDNRTNGTFDNMTIINTGSYCVKWSRTTAADNGGVIFNNILCNGAPAAGWLFTSTAATTEFPAQIINCVSNAIAGHPAFELVNAVDVYFANDWITSTDSPALQVTAGGQIAIVGGTYSGTYVLNFIGSSSTITSVSAVGMFGSGSTSSFNNNAAVTNFVYMDSSQLNLNGTISLGSNTVYRCATAGNLRAGALTITSADCGSTTDTGLRVR